MMSGHTPLVALSLLAGCGLVGGSSVPVAEPSNAGPTVPGLYLTSTPCVNFQSDVMIALLSDNLYQLTVTDRDDACEPVFSFVYLGRWELSSDARIITLVGAPEPLTRIAVVDRLTLRLKALPGPVEEQQKGRADYRVVTNGRLVPFRDPFGARGLRVSDTVWKVVP